MAVRSKSELRGRRKDTHSVLEGIYEKKREKGRRWLVARKKGEGKSEG